MMTADAVTSEHSIEGFIAENKRNLGPEDAEWIRRNPLFVTSGDFRARVMAAHDEARRLGVPWRSRGYWEFLERRGYGREESMNETAELHPDFPRGADLDLLIYFREKIRKLFQEAGLESSGSGCGVDGADVSFNLPSGRQLWVSIAIKG